MAEKKSDPTVLIVGAGTGGLMLALLCEKGNIPYLVTTQLDYSAYQLLKGFLRASKVNKANLQRPSFFFFFFGK